MRIVMSFLDDKLDARARIQLETGELPEELELMIKVEETLSEVQRKTLADIGCRLMGEIGSVIVAKVKTDRLVLLAECAFVRRIEVARELFSDDTTFD